VKKNYKQAKLTDRQRALCEYADKLTREPWKMRAKDLEPLRRQGLTDRDILDAVEIIAYFNYINRVADALNVDLETGMPSYPKQERRF
jgi:uncharacterized peroxidase-related enzyme